MVNNCKLYCLVFELFATILGTIVPNNSAAGDYIRCQEEVKQEYQRMQTSIKC